MFYFILGNKLGKIGFSVLHCFDPELIINYTDAGNLI